MILIIFSIFCCQRDDSAPTVSPRRIKSLDSVQILPSKPGSYLICCSARNQTNSCLVDKGYQTYRDCTYRVSWIVGSFLQLVVLGLVIGFELGDEGVRFFREEAFLLAKTELLDQKFDLLLLFESCFHLSQQNALDGPQLLLSHILLLASVDRIQCLEVLEEHVANVDECFISTGSILSFSFLSLGRLLQLDVHLLEDGVGSAR